MYLLVRPLGETRNLVGSVYFYLIRFVINFYKSHISRKVDMTHFYPDNIKPRTFFQIINQFFFLSGKIS